MAGAKQFPLWQAGVGAGRARLSSGRRSRNQSGARTFLSAATSNGSKALERSDPVEYSGVAADKNVRAPVAFQKSSRFAQTFASSKIQRAGLRSASCGGALNKLSEIVVSLPRFFAGGRIQPFS